MANVSDDKNYKVFGNAKKTTPGWMDGLVSGWVAEIASSRLF